VTGSGCWVSSVGRSAGDELAAEAGFLFFTGHMLHMHM
jgi:hypothetical protein